MIAVLGSSRSRAATLRPPRLPSINTGYLDVKINGTNCFLARDQRAPSRASSQARPLCGYPTKG